MKILFAYPFFLKDSVLEQGWNTPYFPLGLLYLAAATRNAGHAVSVFDGTFANGIDDFYATFEAHRPDVVCITSLITLRGRALELGQWVSEQGASVVFGGPDATFEPQPYAALGATLVLGAGEQTLVELLVALQNEHYSLSSIRGIAYCENDTLTITKPRPTLRDLNQLPLPARDLLDFEPYHNLWRQHHGYTSITIAATRGCDCETGCEDCIPSNFGVNIRYRSPQRVAAEMWQLEAEYKVDRFRLVDDLEALGRDWLVALGEAMQTMGVRTPYEGLKPLHFGPLPMYAPQKDLCAERTVWLPGVDQDPAALDIAVVQRRWEQGLLMENESVAPTCKNCS